MWCVLFLGVFFVPVFPTPSSRRRLSILVAGNGCDLLPRFLERAGCRVEVLDISRVASTFAEMCELSEEDVAGCERFLADGGACDSSFWAEGGACLYLTGDLFDLAQAPGPFDVIICRSLLHGFSPEDARLAIRSLDVRLAPDGVLFVGLNNIIGFNPEALAILEKIGRPMIELGYSSWNAQEERPKGKMFVPASQLAWSLSDLA